MKIEIDTESMGWLDAHAQRTRGTVASVLREVLADVRSGDVSEWEICPACGWTGRLPECGACEGCLLSGEGGRFGGRREGCGGRCGCSDAR